MVEKIPKMNKVEMVRSDISGKLFLASECEVLTIKIVKGKNEDASSLFENMSRNYNNNMAEEKFVVVDNGKPATDVKVDTSSPEFSKAMHIKRSVIPPAMKDLFQKPPELL